MVLIHLWCCFIGTGFEYLRKKADLHPPWTGVKHQLHGKWPMAPKQCPLRWENSSDVGIWAVRRDTQQFQHLREGVLLCPCLNGLCQRVTMIGERLIPNQLLWWKATSIHTPLHTEIRYNNVWSLIHFRLTATLLFKTNSNFQFLPASFHVPHSNFLYFAEQP